MEFHVYILYSTSYDRYYIGQTNNLESRLERHNKGYVRSTKPYKPWNLVYAESFGSRLESMKRESYLKRLKSKTAIKELVDASRWKSGFWQQSEGSIAESAFIGRSS